MNKVVNEPALGVKLTKILAAICGLVIFVCLVWIAISYVKTRKSNNKKPGVCKTTCYFEPLKLPRRAGCWTIQLNPNRFSRKVCIPDGVNFTLKWEKNTPTWIKNSFGRVIPFDRPKTTKIDLGCSAGNSVLQFKGQGALYIYIEPKS